MVSLIRKKMAKKLFPEEIADMLEENLSLVKEIYTLLEQYPELSDGEILYFCDEKSYNK